MPKAKQHALPAEDAPAPPVSDDDSARARASRFSFFCVAVSLTLCALVGALGFVEVQVRELGAKQQSSESQSKEDHDTITHLERKLVRVASKVNDGNHSLIDLIDDLKDQRDALKASARRHNAKLERLLGRLRVDSNGTLSSRGRAPLPPVGDPLGIKEDDKDQGGGESAAPATPTGAAARAEENPRASLQKNATQEAEDDDDDDDDDGKTDKRGGKQSKRGNSKKHEAKGRKKRGRKHG